MAEWISLHTFYAGDIDRLISRGIGPLVSFLEGKGQLREFFFLRYWEGGPHVRLRLLPARDPASQATHPLSRLAEAQLTRYLAAHPSPARPPLDAYRRLAERLAQAEGLASYERRIRARDTVERIAYRPVFADFGGPAAVTAAERHFTVSSQIALSLLTEGADPGRRAGVAAGALVLALAAWEPDATQVGRMLTEGRERWRATPEEDRYGDGYPRQRAALERLVRRCWRLAVAEPDANRRDPLHTWWRSISALRHTLAELRVDGRLGPVRGDPSFAAPGIRAGPRDELLVLLRCVHLLHNRLGLIPRQEAYLRFLVGSVLTALTSEGFDP